MRLARSSGAAAAILALAVVSGCNEDKYAAILDSGPKPTATPVVTTPPSAAVDTPRKRRTAADCAPAGATVSFRDDYVENEVRRKLAKDGGTVSPADLKTVQSLNLTGGHIAELDPCVFPLFTGLKWLYIGAGDYDDLSPIADLTLLETLRASDNKVANLKPLEKLVHLDRLDLSHSAVVDIKSIGYLVNLTELSLDHLEMSDIAPLANCKKLMKLSIRETAVKDLSPLKDLKALKDLNIAGTAVDDITPIKGLMDHGMKLHQK